MRRGDDLQGARNGVLSGVFLNPSLCSFSFQKTNTGQLVKVFNPKQIGTLTGALTRHTPEGAYSGADSAQNVYRYNMTEHMLQQYALDNQRDILAVSKGDTAAEKRVIYLSRVNAFCRSRYWI